MNEKVIFVLILVLFFTSFSFSQIEKGDKEIVFAGSLISLVGNEYYSSLNANFFLSYGYFITNNLQIGVGPSLTYSRTTMKSAGEFSEEEEVKENTDFSGYVFFNYNFSTSSKTVPYISGQWFQYDLSPEEGEKFSDYSYVNIGFGIRNFLSEYAALNTALNYGFPLSSERDNKVILLTIGVSVFL